MRRNQQKIAASRTVAAMAFLLNAIVLEQGLVSDPKWYNIAYITFPLMLIYVITFRKQLYKQQGMRIDNKKNVSDERIISTASPVRDRS